MSSMDFSLTNLTSEEEFIERSVAYMKEHIQFTSRDDDKCILGLSGGSTPKVIYEKLGQDTEIDWSKVWIFLVDERCVPPDHPESNQRMVRETLLKNADVPERQIYFPLTDLDINQCISDYSAKLEVFFESTGPELITLGLGEDGHTASLFPPLRQEAFSEDFVIHTITDDLSVRDRISLTLPRLQQAEHKLFLLKGANKKIVWEEMMESDGDEERWPAMGVLGSKGCSVITYW